MSDHNHDTFGECDNCQLESRLYGGICENCDNEYFTIKGLPLWEGRNLYNLYRESSMPWEWQEKIIRRSNELGMLCFSTPFDETAVDFLEKINVPAYKIASFENTECRSSVAIRQRKG